MTAWPGVAYGFYELDIGIVPNMVAQIYFMENTVTFLYERLNVVHAASWDGFGFLRLAVMPCQAFSDARFAC
jgi:hypothetical protein